MVELVDTIALEASARDGVGVRVPLSLPKIVTANNMVKVWVKIQMSGVKTHKLS